MRCNVRGPSIVRGSAIVLVVGLLAAVCGCATKPKPEQLQAFLLQPRAPVSAAEYRIYPPDVIKISSMRVPEINGETQQVRPDGKINLPLIGELDVVEKTPREVEELLIKKAGEFYEQADATVSVAGYRSQSIYVFGQVGRPGPQPWTGMDTLLDVLARVQPTQLAWPERVKVVRAKEPQRGGYENTTTAPAEAGTGKTKPILVDAEGRPINKAGAHEIVVDLMAMVKTGDMSRNILLKPGDVIYVPPNPFAEVGLALQSVLYPVRPVLEAIRVPSSVSQAASPGQ